MHRPVWYTVIMLAETAAGSVPGEKPMAISSHFRRPVALGIIAFVAVVLAALPLQASECKPQSPQSGHGAIIRILPLGDSITQGGRRDRPEYTYRYPLYYMLLDAGYRVDFIGSQAAGLHADAVWPARNGVAFDPDHEGHYGWKTAEIRDCIAEWIAAYPAPPDIALIHLGSNDLDAGNNYSTIVRPLMDIIETLRRANPKIVVLVGHLNDNGATPWLIRQMVEGMAWWMDTEESPVETVDHYDGWVADPDAPGAHTFDHAHPNERGQARMAEAWFAKLKPYLDRLAKERISAW